MPEGPRDVRQERTEPLYDPRSRPEQMRHEMPDITLRSRPEHGLRLFEMRRPERGRDSVQKPARLVVRRSLGDRQVPPFGTVHAEVPGIAGERPPVFAGVDDRYDERLDKRGRLSAAEARLISDLPYPSKPVTATNVNTRSRPPTPKDGIFFN